LLKNLNNMIIIYVEDDKASRLLLKNALESIVHKVYLARNGEEGLALYQKVLPDIVLTDMLMPKMNGLEMAKKIRAIQPKQAIGMFTGGLESHLLGENNADLIDVYLTKPINRQEFHKALNQLVKLSQQH